MLYSQKIYDTTAGWCFYVLNSITATPLTGQTTPNHAATCLGRAVSLLAA